MAQDYARVLKALDSPFKVIGRGENSAREFESAMGIPAQIGGIEKALQNELPPKTAIVAVGVEQLASVTTQLLQAGTKGFCWKSPEE